MSKYRILTSIPEAFAPYCIPMFDTLEEGGCEVVKTWFSEGLPPEEFLKIAPTFDGAIVGLDRITRDVMSAGLPRFKVVSKFGVGVDAFDIKSANELGFVLCNVPGANSEAVADFALMFMLSLGRQLGVSERELKANGYAAQVGVQFGGKTLGIIGLGNIGTRVALRARYGFNMRIIANDLVERPDFAISHHIEYLPKDEIYRQADFISIHTPLTTQTRNMITKRELSMMKKTAYLINTARGGIINEDDLYDALVNKTIAGSASDVWVTEPPTGHKLLTLENFSGTTHTAGSTPEALTKIGLTAAHNVLRVLNGIKPIYTVTPNCVANLIDA